MAGDPEESERRARRTDEVERLRAAVDRLEGRLDSVAGTAEWKPMRSRCTHCHRGYLVRSGMTVRCRACGYQSG